MRRPHGRGQALAGHVSQRDERQLALIEDRNEVSGKMLHGKNFGCDLKWSALDSPRPTQSALHLLGLEYLTVEGIDLTRIQRWIVFDKLWSMLESARKRFDLLEPSRLTGRRAFPDSRCRSASHNSSMPKIQPTNRYPIP